MNRPPRVLDPGPAAREAVRREAERRLSPAEIEAWLAEPMGDDERAEVDALIAWFRRRYPTAKERLAWCRRAHARWMRPGAAEPPGR